MKINKLTFLMLLIVSVYLTACSSDKGENLSQTADIVGQETEINIPEDDKSRLETAQEDDSVQIILGNVQAKAGDTIDMPIYIVNNPGILGMSMCLSYDENILELVDIESSNEFESIIPLTYAKDLHSGSKLIWSG